MIWLPAVLMIIGFCAMGRLAYSDGYYGRPQEELSRNSVFFATCVTGLGWLGTMVLSIDKLEAPWVLAITVVLAVAIVMFPAVWHAYGRRAYRKQYNV